MLTYVIGSGLGWTFFDFARRRVGETVSAVPAVIFIMLIQTLINLPFGGWAEPFSQNASWWSIALASVLTNAVANVFFVMGVQRAPFTLGVPLLSLTPALAATVGTIYHGENLTLQQWAGVAVVVGFALWLGWRGESRRLTRREVGGLMMMATTALLWAITPFFDRACTLSGQVRLTIYVASQCMGVAIALLIPGMLNAKTRVEILSTAKRYREWWKWSLIAAIAASVGLYFQIKGISVGAVGLFEAFKRSTTLLLSLGLGFFVLKEPLTRAKIVAAIGMAVGIFLLA